MAQSPTIKEDSQNSSTPERAFFENLRKAQMTAEGLFKDHKAELMKYKYSTLAGVMKIFKEYYSPLGFCIFHHYETNDTGDITFLITCLYHQEGYSKESKINITQFIKESEKSDRDDDKKKSAFVATNTAVQSCGSVTSYLKRINTLGLTGMVQEDDDGAGGAKDWKNKNNSYNPNQHAQVTHKNPMEELKKLCESANIDMKEFGLYHKLNSQNIKTVHDAVDNWQLYKDRFLNQPEKSLGKIEDDIPY